MSIVWRTARFFLLVGVLSLGVIGCRSTSLPHSPTMTPAEINQAVPTAADPLPIPPTATVAAPAVPTPEPTIAPTPTTEPPPTPTPDPLAPFTLAGLRAADYPAGDITIVGEIERSAALTHSAITYQSDGLTITGRMHLPAGDGPFPVIILIHGYMPREAYWSGWGTWQSADYFARRGYIAIAPDLRSWGGSDSGLSLFQTGLVRDVINLISALPSLPQADPERIGLWGHSMGGGISTKVTVVDERVDAAVLYAPNSPDDGDLLGRWGAACRPGEAQAAGDSCNPSEIMPPGTPPEVVDAYYAAVAEPERLRPIAPIYHLAEITAPLQIHIGTEDGQALSGTPPEWSAKLAAGLAAAGREHDYFIYDGQGHFFEGEAWVQMMERALALFERELKGESGP